MWNFEFKFLITDDVDLRNFDADTGTINSGNKELTVERHFLLDHLRSMSYVGRLYQDPKPAYEPNTDNIRGKQALYPILEPFDLKGSGSASHRHLDPTAGRLRLYLPSLRRCAGSLNLAALGQALRPDGRRRHYGYAGNPA
jgi:hypothetical protein